MDMERESSLLPGGFRKEAERERSLEKQREGLGNKHSLPIKHRPAGGWARVALGT